jgi:hypothetical protein
LTPSVRVQAEGSAPMADPEQIPYGIDEYDPAQDDAGDGPSDC